MSRTIFHLALALLLAVFARPGLSDERILDYRSDIEIHRDGSLAVTETIRVRAEGRSIRRGIYRDFPTRYRDRFGNHVNADFTPLGVRRDGGAEPWHTKSLSNGVRIYMGSANRQLEPGIHEYELRFSTNRQLGWFDDHDELYFNAIGHGWAFPIDHAETTVTLPFDLTAGEMQTAVYTGHYGSRASDAQIEVLGANRVRFVATRVLQPREGMTIAVGWPKGLIAEPTASQKIRWFLDDNAAALVLLLGLVLPLLWYLWAWNRVGKDPQKGIIIPRFEPPTGLSPAATRYVRDMSFGRDAFTAAVISLAVKGQIAITEDDDGDFTLERVNDPPATELTRGEQSVMLKLLPYRGATIELKNENAGRFQLAQSALKRALKKEYLGRLFHLNRVYIIPAVLMSAAAALIALFFDSSPGIWITYVVLTLVLHGLFTFLLRAPTRAGRQVMDEIEGLKMYLGTAERERLDRMRSPELTPEVFETFLPYAYALGVANKWADRFAREMPREIREGGGYQPVWYHGRFSGAGALHHLGSGFSRSFSSAIASASTPPGSSSGSGGGGFSGGGGGGGGGGGW